MGWATSLLFLTKLERINMQYNWKIIKSIFLGLGCLIFSFSSHAHSVNHHETSAIHHSAESSDASKAYLPTDLVKRYSLTGDDSLIEQGWASMPSDWQSSEKTVARLLFAAWLSQAEHKFDAAMDFTHQALELHPNNPQALILKASIATVSGDISSAKQACRALAGVFSPIASVACSARFAETGNQQQLVLERLIKLLELPVDEEIHPWVVSIAADMARETGNHPLSKKLYLESISAFPSIQVRAAYADLLLKTEDYREVLNIIEPHNSVPALAVRRLLAAQQLGGNEEHAIQRMDHLFKEWINQGDMRHAREMAMFYLQVVNNPKLAHSLAKENLKIQQEPEDFKLVEIAKLRLSLQN